jgi:redox-sensitive bicupin YhaK (pirin superfamily)
VKKRKFLTLLSTVTGIAVLTKYFHFTKSKEISVEKSPLMNQFPLDFQWPTLELFLFCVHHYDFYPPGNGNYGPEANLLKGRDLGADFQAKDGFRMYHGEEVPGFPVHPHRGFETITIVRKGYVDHADSIGAAGRYGQGDVQWMTAGSGVQHSEMFPLLKNDSENTLELFQIWINLPKKSKMVNPHFKMLWSEQIPKLKLQKGKVELTLIAGEWDGVKPPSPPPDSWASQKESETLILLLKLQPNTEFELPMSENTVSRALYFFEGEGLEINLQKVSSKTGFQLNSQIQTKFKSTSKEIEILLLQSKPIGEPVVQHGPFVMSSREEILQTIQDYQRTQFGGWPWDRHDMVHGSKIERFAKNADGKIEKPI